MPISTSHRIRSFEERQDELLYHCADFGEEQKNVALVTKVPRNGIGIGIPKVWAL